MGANNAADMIFVILKHVFSRQRQIKADRTRKNITKLIYLSFY